MSDITEAFGPDPALDPEMAAAIRRAEEIAVELGHGPLEEPWDRSSSGRVTRRSGSGGTRTRPCLPRFATACSRTRGDIPVRLSARWGRGTSVIVYFHGGGWVVRDLDTHYRATSCLRGEQGDCAGDGCMAPEVKYPVPLDDCVATVRHVAANAASMGLDGGRLALAGDSAGASLSMATSLLLRDAGGSPVRSQVLVYGAYEKVEQTPSRRRYGDGRYGLATEEMQWYGPSISGTA